MPAPASSGSYAGDNSVYPDGFTFRFGVTTVADAGGSGWRNFDDFKAPVIDRSKTRVLAFLNIVGNGMRGGEFEQDLGDMEAQATADDGPAAQGPHRRHQDGALRGAGVDAGRARGRSGNRWRDVPVMVDFGTDHPGTAARRARDEEAAAGRHLHARLLRACAASWSTGQPNPALLEGRKRGVIFDVGHGGGSFLWRVAVPAVQAGFLPDSISTDLHIGSMNAGMKDMLNVMSKFLALGVPLRDVIQRSTWNPAREIGQDGLGHLSAGAAADIAVLRLEHGQFGFVDVGGGRCAAPPGFCAR